MLTKEQLQEIGRAHTHINQTELQLEDYKKHLDSKRIQEGMLRKHEADDNYNPPAAERTAKQTMILENRLFPNVPLARYFIIPIWNAFAELFSGKRILTNLFKITVSALVIAGCVTAIFFFPPVLSVFIANAFFSATSLLTLAGIITVALYVGNFVTNLIENHAHKNHWNRYECTRVQEQYFQMRYGIDKETSQIIKAYLINKEHYSQSPVIQEIAADLLNKLRISDEEALNDIAVFFIGELKVLERSKPDEADKQNFERWKKDSAYVLNIVEKLFLARNLNGHTYDLLKGCLGRREFKAWISKIDTLIDKMALLLTATPPNQTEIAECDKLLVDEFKKIKPKEIDHRPEIHFVLRKYNQITLKKKECEKAYDKIIRFKALHTQKPDLFVSDKSVNNVEVLDHSFKKRLGI